MIYSSWICICENFACLKLGTLWTGGIYAKYSLSPVVFDLNGFTKIVRLCSRSNASAVRLVNDVVNSRLD